MLCEKCKARPATVHITQMTRRSAEEASGQELSHHFCEVCGPEFMQNSPGFKTASFSKPSLRMELHKEPASDPQPPQPQIDTRKRYDVYCLGANRAVVVYRNALFKGASSLLSGAGGRIVHHDFIELEQSNGQTVFISRNRVFTFCEPGTALVAEEVAQPT